jgi:ribosome-associated protein
MIEVTPSLKIDESEIQVEFIHASGPGGQNVNKVATAAQLRFDIRKARELSPEVKERLEKLVGSRVTSEGVLIIEAKRYRTQEQNRFDAFQRLIKLIQQALIIPKVRKATHPSVTAKAARVDSKVRRGTTKRTRHYYPEEWE